MSEHLKVAGVIRLVLHRADARQIWGGVEKELRSSFRGSHSPSENNEPSQPMAKAKGKGKGGGKKGC